MRLDSSPLDDHLARLLQLRERCGDDLYRRALTAARVAVARTVLEEAERLAGVGRERTSATVVRFPTGRRFPPRDSGRGGPESKDRRDDS